jgi:alpha-tubulin suppressor-like RCC1 family protein
VAVETTGALTGRLLVDVAVGNRSRCVLAEDGQAFCWGTNGSGQLGTGDTTDSLLPRPVDTSGALQGKKLIIIDLGSSHGCGLDADGVVYCWGANMFGQLGNGTTTNTALPTPVSAGAATGERFVDLDTGSNSTCAVAASGRAYCWGVNDYGQLGNGTKINSSVPVGVSTATSLANKRVVQVDVGQYHTCAVDSDRVAHCWGSGTTGRLGDGLNTDTSRPVAVSTATALSGRKIATITAGVQHSCSADSSGRVACWGFNGNMQIGDGTNLTRSTPTAVLTNGLLGPERVFAVDVDTFSTCSLAESGHAFCWGAGPLGDGTSSQSGAPVKVVDFGP